MKRTKNKNKDDHQREIAESETLTVFSGAA